MIEPVKDIQKEEINSLTFPKESVDRLDANAEKQLRAMLEQAVILGNRYKDKIKIKFKDSEGTKMVETTVWHASHRHVVLKGGVTIPFNRIESIQI